MSVAYPSFELTFHTDSKGRTIAWESYHRLACPLTPRFDYALSQNLPRNKADDEHLELTARLLWRLIWALLSHDQLIQDVTVTNGAQSEGNHSKSLIEWFEKAIEAEPKSVAMAQDNFQAKDGPINRTSKGQLQHFEESFESFASLLPRDLNKLEQNIVNTLLPLFQASPVATKPCNRSFVSGLLARFGRNNHVVTDERLQAMGHAILPKISRACNHSCAPSAVIVPRWDSSALQPVYDLRSIQGLNDGDEITIPYVDPILPLSERQSNLNQSYGFECDCVRCTYQASLPASIIINPALPTDNDLFHLFRTAVGPAMQKMIRQRPFAPQSTILDHRLPKRLSLKDLPISLHRCLGPEVLTPRVDIFFECLEKQDWQGAILAGTLMMGIYVTVYGWRWGIAALRFLDLAKAIFNEHMVQQPRPGQSQPFAYELLLQAGVYLIWAQEGLQCTIAEGGNLCDGIETGGPHGDAKQLEDAIRSEWMYLLGA